MNNAIGWNIRAHRERQSWTQEHLAAAADVSVRTIQRAEEGQTVAAESLQAIAGALDVTPELLRADFDESAIRSALHQADGRYKFVQLERIERASDLRRFMPVDGHQVDFTTVTDEEAADAAARLEQGIKDIGDLWRDLEPVQRHEALKELQDEIHTLASRGFVTTAGVDEMRLRSQHSGQEFTMNVLRVVISPASEPKLVAVRDKKAPVSFA